MLVETQINKNKEIFIELIRGVEIEGADIEGLISFLESSDFFIAPASTQYNNAYDGGLCEHSLEVYYNLEKLVETFGKKAYPSSTLKIIGLLHDLNKINFYEKYVKNRKVYSLTGTKYDEMGKYDWVSEHAFAVKDAKERYVAGNRGVNTFLLISKYIPLSQEEVVALLNFSTIKDDSEYNYDLGQILLKYNLTALLHTADFLATYNSDNYEG